MILVTPKMIASFRAGSCEESEPCQHYCKIVLSDGTSRMIGMSGLEIDAMLKSVDTKKIMGRYGKDHFARPLCSRICSTSPYFQRKPNEILTTAFNQREPEFVQVTQEF